MRTCLRNPTVSFGRGTFLFSRFGVLYPKILSSVDLNVNSNETYPEKFQVVNRIKPSPNRSFFHIMKNTAPVNNKKYGMKLG